MSGDVTIINHTDQDLHFEVPELDKNGNQQRAAASVVTDEDGKPMIRRGAPLIRQLRVGPKSNAEEGGYPPQVSISREDWERLLKGNGNRELLRDLARPQKGAPVISIHGASL